MGLMSGIFIAVVGPSGAGKDSLIGFAKQELRRDSRFVFARRMITRPPDITEDHKAVDELEFKRLAAAGAFALSWEAHGLHYGIPSDVHADLARGKTVIANLSRGVLSSLRNRFSRVLVVEVTAPPETLAARLAHRARESADGQAQRLRRSDVVLLPVAADVTIVNDGDLRDAGDVFVDALLRVVAPSDLMFGL